MTTPNTRIDFPPIEESIPIKELSVTSPEQLRAKEFLRIYNQRLAKPNDMGVQKALAPEEHRLFARNVVQNNPLMAAPLAVGAMGYPVAKAMGYSGGYRPGDPLTTPPSAQQMGQGLLGIGQGLKGAAQDQIQKISDLFSRP